MKETLGSEFIDFKNSLASDPPVSVRLNIQKMNELPGEARIPWCDSGFYLKERPVFTLDPHFHAGAYYVQEASSMFLEQAIKASVDLNAPLRVLDLCAAPGGKSTHLLNLLNNESLLISNEVIHSRSSILSENIQKWGHGNVVVTNNDPKDLTALTGYFDLIVVDAPCSGEGLFRKDNAAIEEWSQDNVNLCASRQKRILSDVWPSLKENGVLIYCTCTYNETENEDNLKWLSQQKDIEFIDLPLFPGIQKTLGYRFLPHRVNGEGFFIAAIRKLSKENAVKIKSNPIKLSKNDPGWLNGSYKYVEIESLLIAMPNVELPTLNFELRGTAVASVMRNKLVPEHALALNTSLREDIFPVIELNKQDALKYLAKDTIAPVDNERGFAIVSFEGSNLGFVNRLGNRINNLYPVNWRIRMNINS